MTAPHVPLDVLDLVSVSEGSTIADAIASSMAAAELADELGSVSYTHLTLPTNREV